MRSSSALVRLAAAAALAAGSLALTAGAAHASTAYKVSGTDGTLAEQSQPATGHFVRWLHEGDTVDVVCQVNDGGTDVGDGGNFPWQQSRTWDQLTDGNWVYDHFITTPAQGSDGYSPGVPHCGTSRSVHVGDDYPAAWKNQGKDAFANLWGLNRECVTFVAWKIYENSGGRQVPTGNAVPSDYSRYSINVDQDWGNAANWSSYAAATGVRMDHTPTPGSVAQWNAGGGMTVGHVAIVTAVHADGSIDIEQYNLREDGRYSTLHFAKGSSAVDTSNGHGPWTVRWPDNFIHINGF